MVDSDHFRAIGVIRGPLLYNSRMQLKFRLATESDHAALEKLVIDSFEPITWQKNLDAKIGPLNGCDWRQRWANRLQKIFATQIVLVGEFDNQLAAMASATIDRQSALGHIDVLCVGAGFQGRGFGRQILRGISEHLKTAGCHYVQLECLTTNEPGNSLYKSEGFQEVARHIRWFKTL
jgi:ribosomal protein S18 acetylase RimI-like enzyme